MDMSHGYLNIVSMCLMASSIEDIQSRCFGGWASLLLAPVMMK